MRMASHTTLARLPVQPARKAVPREAHIPDAALPCRRRPDVFQHPLLDNSENPHGLHGPDGTAAATAASASPDQRRQHLVLLRTARDLCASCPLWAECLQDAVAYAEPYGYTAATTREDRRALRRMLGIGDEHGDLPAHAAVRFDSGSLPRRLTRLRSRADESSAHPATRRQAPPELPELERILDAFDLLQGQLAHDQPLLRERTQSGTPTPLLQSHITSQATDRQPPPTGGPSHTPGPSDDRSEEPMAAAEAGQRITFSYEDPALAVRQAVLGPLVRSALPALASLEQLVAMLTCMPGGTDTAPESPRNIPAVREAVESLLPVGADAPEGAEGTPLPPQRPLTGSVSVELATTDPVAALRRDFLEPLLRELAATLANIEKVATMLAAASDETGDAHLETIRTALREIHDRLPRSVTPTPHPPTHPAHAGHRAEGTGHARRAASAPSIRAAVEKAIATFPGAFSARDVLRALPAGVYGDPSKTISNVLSALVKSGRLQRLSRGTYARVLDVLNVEDIDDTLLPERGEAKSA
ncbi:WhiB family transcriptional regulator [Streptomyces sp. CA-210063]|uniref:WhiB family transcriptional regulator n=1 Tax=Streptomyces sp. CA-210063 TaxID=2801029 RepID=UPI00214D0AD4|nr:WhiB family transcriptional regulator [Streptomyces sp. CA-210063]UUU32222.1 WhiB family transcriptional regulator [Streptomyces sp. CA-210063]